MKNSIKTMIHKSKAKSVLEVIFDRDFTSWSWECFFFFSLRSFTFSNFYLDFYFPFPFGLLMEGLCYIPFLFGFLFSLFSLDFYFPFIFELLFPFYFSFPFFLWTFIFPLFIGLLFNRGHILEFFQIFHYTIWLWFLDEILYYTWSICFDLVAKSCWKSELNFMWK